MKIYETGKEWKTKYREIITDMNEKKIKEIIKNAI